MCSWFWRELTESGIVTGSTRREVVLEKYKNHTETQKNFPAVSQPSQLRSARKLFLSFCVYKYLITVPIEQYQQICYLKCTKRINTHKHTETLLKREKGGSLSMIVLDYQDRRPLYEQIVEKFRHLILNGALKPGEKMPSVRQLAMDLSINPNTVQRAYMQLEQEGLIYPVKGKGNFIADSQEVRKASVNAYKRELKSLIQKGKVMGMEEEELIYIIRECYKEGMS